MLPASTNTQGRLRAVKEGRATAVVRVDVDSVDLRTRLGVDWLVEAQIRATLSDPVASFDLSIKREDGGLLRSLSPLLTASFDDAYALYEVLDIGKPLTIYEASAAHGGVTPPAGATIWAPVFKGYVDKVDPGGEDDDVIGVAGRDLGGVLQDRWIEEQIELAAQPVEDAMQEVLDVAYASGWLETAITLRVSGTPAWSCTAHLVEKQPIMDALRMLAALMGWDVRYRWWAGTGDFELVLYEPDRGGSSLHTFTEDDYDKVQRAERDIADVRNVVKVFYTSIGDPTDSGRVAGDRYLEEDSDATSIAAYGRRHMQLSEASTSPIDTQTDAAVLAAAALADLKDPALLASISGLYWPVVEVNDTYVFAPGRHWSAPHTFGVHGYRHRWAEGFGETSFEVRGYPGVAKQVWLGLEARPGLYPTADEVEPDALTITAESFTGDLTNGFGIFEVHWTRPAPRNASPNFDWDLIEVFAEKNMADPGTFEAGASNYIGAIRGDQFVVWRNVTSGDDITYLLRFRDWKRNKRDTSVITKTAP